MNILVHPENIDYFKLITGKEPYLTEALDFENGGRYARADFGPIDNNNIENIKGNSFEGVGYLLVEGVRVARLSWGLQVQYTAYPLASKVVYSDCRPYDGKEVSEYGRLIELGKDNYSEVETYYTHIKPNELVLVVTTKIIWGPDGYAAPGNVWAVYWDGENDPVIQKIRPATHSDYPRGHAVHRGRGHKCEVCQ